MDDAMERFWEQAGTEAQLKEMREKIQQLSKDCQELKTNESAGESRLSRPAKDLEQSQLRVCELQESNREL